MMMRRSLLAFAFVLFSASIASAAPAFDHFTYRLDGYQWGGDDSTVLGVSSDGNVDLRLKGVMFTAKATPGEIAALESAVAAAHVAGLDGKNVSLVGPPPGQQSWTVEVDDNVGHHHYSFSGVDGHPGPFDARVHPILTLARALLARVSVRDLVGQINLAPANPYSIPVGTPWIILNGYDTLQVENEPFRSMLKSLDQKWVTAKVQFLSEGPYILVHVNVVSLGAKCKTAAVARKTASASSPAEASLAAGDAVTIIGKSGSWLEVALANGQKAFVPSSAIDLGAPSSPPATPGMLSSLIH